ncbi:MAG: response regulator transcription factor [Chloroflexota bacterium]
MARILTADDNQDLCALLGFALARAGHTQTVAHDGAQALALAQREGPDLVVLDTAMPAMTGYAVASQIRQSSDVPIILIAEAADEEAQLYGFACGADEYVVKPFSVLVLVKRIDALLRRSGLVRRIRDSAGRDGGAEKRPLPVGNAAFHVDRNVVVGANGKKYHLTPKEGRILVTLARHRPRALSASALLEEVWGYGTGDSAVVVKTHIYHLRRKLAAATGGHQAIHTVPGAGYLFDDALERTP